MNNQTSIIGKDGTATYVASGEKVYVVFDNRIALKWDLRLIDTKKLVRK